MRRCAADTVSAVADRLGPMGGGLHHGRDALWDYEDSVEEVAMEIGDYLAPSRYNVINRAQEPTEDEG